jgi:hypothetical protein
MTLVSIKMDHTQQSSRLTTGQMMTLNHGNISLPASLDDLIKNYAMPACSLSKPYGNPLNPYFTTGHADKSRAAAATRTMGTRRTVASHTDDHIFQDFRKAFASIVKGKDGTVLATMSINRMIIPVTKVKEIGELFFQTMIQCPLQIDEYIRVLFTMKRGDAIDTKIRQEFTRFAIDNFVNPSKLPDTKIADGETLTRNHRETTCNIIAKMFAYDYNSSELDLSGTSVIFSSYEKMQQKFLATILDNIKDGSADSIKILANSLKIVAASGKFPTVLNDYRERLQQIYNNNSFKLTARLPVKDFL